MEARHHRRIQGMPQRNQLAKLEFADIAGKKGAMMIQANLPKKNKCKLCKECFNCATYLSNLSVVTLNGKTATRYKNFHETKPCYPKHLRICEGAGTVFTGKMEK